MGGEGEAHAVPAAIELKRISKSFGAVHANRDIDLVVAPGSIHGIVGENGAGKSTLMNILYGLHQADSGEIFIGGEHVAMSGTADAIRHGIGMVHQHFMLVPNFTVLDNVMLGTEGGMLLQRGRAETRQLLERFARDYGMPVDPDAHVSKLPVGLRQRVEIIKALKGGARVLILDEPTGVLTPQEAQSLFEILRTLKEDGVTVMLITHKLEEIMAVTDAVSIMRNGEMVGHRETCDTSPEELAELMVGRKVLLRVDRGQSAPGEVRLAVKGLTCLSTQGTPHVADLEFELRAGEILGVAGVAGNGQSELLELLAGMRPPDRGTITILGHDMTAERHGDPRAMRSIGVAHIPEDRHRHGLVLGFEARENAVLGYHQTGLAGSGFLLERAALTDHCSALMTAYDVRPVRPGLSARSFSGGNQQKLVTARELDMRPKVLVVGQPTRGVDIGAIEYIHRQLIELRDAGCAILLVSVELDEILGLSDRILVMNAGRQIGLVDRDEADEQTLGLMMAGIAGTEAA